MASTKGSKKFPIGKLKHSKSAVFRTRSERIPLEVISKNSIEYSTKNIEVISFSSENE